VAVVTSRKRKVFIKDLVRMIKLEQSNYSDPITELLLCLHVKYDFDGAQTKLRECEEV
jgi:translation initiation factor 3 subunit E